MIAFAATDNEITVASRFARYSRFQNKEIKQISVYNYVDMAMRDEVHLRSVIVFGESIFKVEHRLCNNITLGKRNGRNYTSK